MVPVSCSGLDALLLGRHDVEREDRQHRAVHRHRHAHLVQRDAVEQLAHVVDRVDRDAGHADVADHPRVVAVVAAVGGQVEGDRQALLARGQVAPVEGVGLRGGGEAGVLPDRPRLVDVHRRVRARAGTARCPGRCRRKSRPVEVGGGVERRDGDALRASPTAGRRRRAGAARRLPCRAADGRASRRVKSGIVMPAPPSVSSVRAQDGEGVAAGEDVAVHAVGQLGACRPARPARRRRPAAPRPHRRRLLGVHLVRRAQAGDRRAARRRTSSAGAGHDVEARRAWNRLAAKLARAVCAASGPSVGEEDGRAAASAGVGRGRAAPRTSCGVADARGSSRRPASAGAGARGTGGSSGERRTR